MLRQHVDAGLLSLFSIMKLLALPLFLIPSIGISIGLADFVPGFMQPSIKESSDPNLPVKPLIQTKRGVDNTPTWYCNRTQSSAISIFCRNNSRNAGVFVYNGGSGDKSKMIDISSKAQSSANQNSMQDMRTKNELDFNKNNFSLPIQPSKDVNMRVGQQQVEINIKY